MVTEVTKPSEMYTVAEIIIACANATLPRILNQLGDPKRTGGHLCIARPDGRVVATALVGYMSDAQNAGRSYILCQEKATRLGRHPDHETSGESATEPGQFKGAVRAGTFIFAFSGLPEIWDEAFVVELRREAFRMNVI